MLISKKNFFRKINTLIYLIKYYFLIFKLRIQYRNFHIKGRHLLGVDALKTIINFSRKRNVKQKHGEEIDRELALKCSQQERNAEKAELQSVDLMKCVFLEPHIGVEFQSIIRSLDSRQIRVELEPYALEWNVPLEALNDDRYFFDQERLYLSGRRQGRLIRIGQRLKLKLIRVDVLQRNIDFDFEGWLN